jgi:hypothetical protein
VISFLWRWIPRLKRRQPTLVVASDRVYGVTNNGNFVRLSAKGLGKAALEKEVERAKAGYANAAGAM